MDGLKLKTVLRSVIPVYPQFRKPPSVVLTDQLTLPEESAAREENPAVFVAAGG